MSLITSVSYNYYKSYRNESLRKPDEEPTPQSQSKAVKTREMRELLRSMNQPKKQGLQADGTYEKKVFEMKTEDIVSSLMSKTDKKEEKETAEINVSYNYKEVASKIQRAKTSTSAGQAVIAAKRKVLELKRKIASGQGDAEELQLALTHAKRMEMVARKKKHHLELEELVVHTQKRDEMIDKMEETAQSVASSEVQFAEEKIYKAEDEIFERREDMLDEIQESFEESGIEISDDMMAELNAMVSEMGEDMLEELEEAMQMLEEMEIIDPHMSEEDLEELKRKHRNQEAKAMMKADMDYLKAMIKHTLEKSVSGPSMSSSSVSISPVFATPAVPAMDVSISEPQPSIDISL